MTRNLKALGLALLAVFAMSAIAASAAQATLKVTVPEPAWLTVEAKGAQRFTIGGTAAFSCLTASAHATVKNGDTSITFTGVGYTGCTAEIGATKAFTTIDMTGCEYVLHGGTSDVANHFINGDTDLVCPEGVTGPDIYTYSDAAHKTKICTYVIWATNNYTAITYTNTTTGTPDDFDIVTDLTLDMKKTQGILCPESVGGKGTYESELTVKAYKDEGTSGGKPVEGKQINVTISE